MMAAVIVFVVIAVLLAYFTFTTLTSTARYVRRNTAACTVAVSPCPVPGTRLNRGDLLSVREHEGNGGWFKIVDGAASGQFLTGDDLAIDQPPRLVAICGTGFAADCPSRLRRPVALCTSVACTEAVNYRAGTRVAVVGGVAAASLVELEITATGVVRYAAPQDIGIEMGSPPVATPTVMPTVAPAEQVAIDPAAVMPPSVRPQDSRSRNAPTARPRDQLPTSPRGNSRSGTNMEAAGNGAYGSYRPPPVATPQPSLAVGPQPINNESRWVTERDYPRSAQEDGISGRTQLLLTIDAAGSIARCDIVQSSGSAALDAAACNAITRRARFKPALDAYGNPTVGTYLKSVRWAL